jgi:hypothetical protein
LPCGTSRAGVKSLIVSRCACFADLPAPNFITGEMQLAASQTTTPTRTTLINI